MADTPKTATLIYNNQQVGLPIYSPTVRPDVLDIRKLYAEGGVFTYDWVGAKHSPGSRTRWAERLACKRVGPLWAEQSEGKTYGRHAKIRNRDTDYR